MGTGTELRDQQGLGRYIIDRILPLKPSMDPVPFRGRVDGSSETLPFYDELDASMRDSPSVVWNVLGPSGCGKSFFARWAAALWGKRFLADPDHSPAVLWIDAARLRAAFADDRALTGGPFAFALAAEVPDQPPESLARLLMKHPFVVIVDKDADPALSYWKLELPMGLPPGLKLLYLAMRDSMGGPCVRLGYWDREMALLAAHRRRGADGVKLIEALDASPAGMLASFPPFVTWLLAQPDATPEWAAQGRSITAYLEALYTAFPGGAATFEDWCAAVLDASRVHASLLLARRQLHLEAAGREGPMAAVFRPFLLGAPLESGALPEVFREKVFTAAELKLFGHLRVETGAFAELLKRSSGDPVITSNLINLYWQAARCPLPARTRLRSLSGLILAGHPFPTGIKGATIESSNLDGISLGKPRVKASRFDRCSFRGASFAGASFHGCKLLKCDFELADFSGCTFEKCSFEQLELTSAILSGAKFNNVAFHEVVFGHTGEGDPLQLRRCVLKSCVVARMAASGISLEECKVSDTDFAGLAPKFLSAEQTLFERCDFLGLAAPGAKLTDADFRNCILADVNLQGADLRRIRLIDVEFQPGPASRAGLTGGLSRDDAMYGSKSGFYAQDLSEGVYLDPDLTRTADLRNADLRGAFLHRTDLFRVDLRGALMDRELWDAALRMHAYLD